MKPEEKMVPVAGSLEDRLSWGARPWFWLSNVLRLIFGFPGFLGRRRNPTGRLRAQSGLLANGIGGMGIEPTGSNPTVLLDPACS